MLRVHGVFESWWECRSEMDETVAGLGPVILPHSSLHPPSPLSVGNFSNFGTVLDSMGSGLADNSLLLDWSIKITTSTIYTLSS